MHIELLQRFDRLAQRRQGRNADMFDEYILRGGGAALHAVEHDHVGAGLHRECGVVIGAGRAYLDVDGFLPLGDFTQLLNLDLEVVRPRPVGMPTGAALIDAGRQIAHAGHAIGNLLPEQHAAAAGLGALADHHFDGIGAAQIIGFMP